MSTRDPVDSGKYQCTQTLAATRAALVEFLSQHPRLDGAADVWMSTDVSAFESAMIPLYEDAFRRGDWLAAEFTPMGDLTLTPGIFEDDARSAQNLWILFHDSRRRLLGATKLVIDTVRGTLIDETQLDPVMGRGKGIMTHYFRTIVPIFSALRLRLRTEFVLTPESRVLRETLIGELGMKVTGIRPGCYRSPNTPNARTALVAYGPARDIEPTLRQAAGDSASVFQPLLDAVCRGVRSLPMFHGASTEQVRDYEEVVVRASDHDFATTFARRGFLPVSFDPFVKAFTMAKVPNDPALYERLGFVKEEGSSVAALLTEYVSDAALPSRTESRTATV